MLNRNLNTSATHWTKKEYEMKKTLFAFAGLAALVGHAATFTGELFAYWYEDSRDCGLYRVEESWKNLNTWRSDYVDVDGQKEPALFGWDCYAFPVTIAEGETFSAEVIHGTSTAAHIKSVKVLTDEQMYMVFANSDEWGESSNSSRNMQELWNGGRKNTRAWIVVEQQNVTEGATYSIDLEKWPIVNADRSWYSSSSYKFYNPADGDGGLSSQWTVSTYARQFGVELSGIRKVTASVWYNVKITGGEVFQKRLWNVCDVFANDMQKRDELAETDEDDELYDVPGLYFITPEMISAQATIPEDVSSGGDSVEKWKVSRTLRGVVTRALSNSVVGIFELKCGKVNKKGVARVSATLTGLDGKKTRYRIRSVEVNGNPVTVDFDGLSITIRGDTISGGEGVPGGVSVNSADVGGNWTRTGAGVYVDFGNGEPLPTGVQESLLPNGEPVLAMNGKWAFNKAATVKLSKDKTQIVWDTSRDKTNLSGLKLTYAPRTGLFKGSFKVYALENTTSGTKRLRKYTVKVTGVVVNGMGYGQAVITRPAGGPWTVVVE